MEELKYAINNLYLLMAGLLVMLMQVGFALFHSGMVRIKNTMDILFKHCTLLAITSIAFLLVGYCLMFGGSLVSDPYFPTFTGGENALKILLKGDSPHHHMAGIFFQMMLVGVVISIVIGASAERIKWGVLAIFGLCLATIIYPIPGYWAWGHGFLQRLGFVDAAGAGVVHLTAGTAAFATALLLGPRADRYDATSKIRLIPSSNMPIATMGMLLVCVGSFGLNTGYFLTHTGISHANLIGTAYVNTFVAMMGGILTTVVLPRLFIGKSDLTFTLNGALMGIVAISASPATANIMWSLTIGIIAAILGLTAIFILNKIKIDDPVGAIATHAVGGGWGLIAAVFSQDYQSLTIERGIAWAWHKQWMAQWIGIWTIFAWVFVTSVIILVIMRLLVGLRVQPKAEHLGLDQTKYANSAYPEFPESHRH